MTTKNGRTITKKEAETYLDAYNQTIEGLRKELLPDLDRRNFPTASTNAARSFLSSKYNAFVFDKELVTRFFEDKNDAKYLVVLLGVHTEADASVNIKKGDATVILLGCIKNESDKFQSLQIAEPASEHPPKVFFVEVPWTDDGTIVLTPSE